MIALAQKIVDRNRVDSPRDDGKFFPENAQRQPGRRHLNDGQKHPAESNFIGDARSADKTRRRRVRRHKGHREHETAHTAAADEIFAEKIFARADLHAAVIRQEVDEQQIEQNGNQKRPVNRHDPSPSREGQAARL